MARTPPLVLLTGGIGLGRRQLLKYQALYPTSQPVEMIPFNLTTVALPRDVLPIYDKVFKSTESFESIHIHTLSGSCHFLVNLLEKHPSLVPKVQSAIFDSPCHVDGMPDALHHLYGVPKPVTKTLNETVFRLAKKTSDTFVSRSLLPGVPTGVIYSDSDIVAPVSAIELMLDKWRTNTPVDTLKSTSSHLLTVRDEPEAYKDFVMSVMEGSEAGEHELSYGT